MVTSIRPISPRNPFNANSLVGSRPPINFNGLVFYAPLWRSEARNVGTLWNGTGIADSVPVALAVGDNTITVTQAGTFTISLPAGCTGTVTTGTATITGSPVTITGANQTVTAEGTGTFTVNLDNVFKSRDINNITCTVTGATWGTTGRTLVGASSHYISLGTPAALNITGDMYIWAWIKPTSVTGTQMIVAKSNGTTFGDGQYELRTNGTGLEMSATNGASSFASLKAGLALNTWAFCEGTFVVSTGVLQSYINTVAGTLATLTGTKSTNALATLIGARKPAGPAQFLSAIVGEVGIMNRVPTTAERTNIYLTTPWRY